MRLGSPGVFTREFDKSTLEQGASNIGPILIGETQKGPAFWPIEVSNFTEYRDIFGDYEDESYVPYAASEILRNTDALTVIRVLGTEGYTNHGALYIKSGSGDGGTQATCSSSLYAVIRPTSGNISYWTAAISQSNVADCAPSSSEFNLVISNGTTTTVYQSLSLFRNDSNYIGNILGFDPQGSAKAYVDQIFDWAVTSCSLATSSVYQPVDGLYSAPSSAENDFTRIYEEAQTPAIMSQKYGGSTQYNLFKIHTLTDGEIANTSIKAEINNIKPPIYPDTYNYGTFNIVIRSYSDTDKRPVILETFTNLNLDPDSPNYIARRIGDRYPSYDSTNNTLTYVGDFDNKSKYVRVEMYAYEGVPDDAVPFGFGKYNTISGSVPAAPFNTGFSYSGQTEYSNKVVPGFDTTQYGVKYLLDALPDNISTTVGQSNFYLGDCSAHPSGGASYTGAIDLTSTTPIAMRKFMVCFAGGFDSIDRTKDKYTYTSVGQLPVTATTDAGYLAFKRGLDIITNPELIEGDLLGIPGLNVNENSAIFAYAENIIESRGNDIMLLLDPIYYGETNVETVTDQVDSYDNSYLAAYWPWCRVLNPDKNKYVYKPAASVALGALKFNDRVAYPWFAPAGLNRGVLTTVKDVEIRLTEDQRDTLYDGRVNPIAYFKNDGVVVWGQKNLQNSESLTNRLNVRRMLITAKRLIRFAARYLVFEPNDSISRTRLLNLVNPILDNIRQNRGINVFKVIVDETNNTPDVIDRNILYGQIFIQPTTAAEFISLDFYINKSGVTFSQ